MSSRGSKNPIQLRTSILLLTGTVKACRLGGGLGTRSPRRFWVRGSELTRCQASEHVNSVCGLRNLLVAKPSHSGRANWAVRAACSRQIHHFDSGGQRSADGPRGAKRKGKVRVGAKPAGMIIGKERADAL